MIFRLSREQNFAPDSSQSVFYTDRIQRAENPFLMVQQEPTFTSASLEGDMEICSVAVISNPSVCDVCVFHVAVFGELKLFAVL